MFYLQYLHIPQCLDTILHLLYKVQLKLAWMCSQIYTPLSPKAAEVNPFFFLKFFMQFQIILWEFNCKSNKNIKSYYMLYENIVSNLLMFLKKYSSRLHLIGREMPACHSVALPIRHKHPLLFSAVTSGRLTVRCTAYRVCLHSSVNNI